MDRGETALAGKCRSIPFRRAGGKSELPHFWGFDQELDNAGRCNRRDATGERCQEQPPNSVNRGAAADGSVEQGVE